MKHYFALAASMGLLLAILLSCDVNEPTRDVLRLKLDSALASQGRVEIEILDTDSNVVQVLWNGELANPENFSEVVLGPEVDRKFFHVRIRAYDSAHVLTRQELWTSENGVLYIARTDVAARKPRAVLGEGAPLATIILPGSDVELREQPLGDGPLPFSVPESQDTLRLSIQRTDSNTVVRVNGVVVEGDFLAELVKDTTLFRVALIRPTDSVNYELIAVRPPSTEARLKTLGISEGALSPAFDADSLHYLWRVGSHVASVQVFALPLSPKARVTLNAVPMGADGGSPSIELSADSSSLTVTVTAQNPASKRLYRLNLIREAAGMDGMGSGDTLVTLELPGLVLPLREFTDGAESQEVALPPGKDTVEVDTRGLAEGTTLEVNGNPADTGFKLIAQQDTTPYVLDLSRSGSSVRYTLHVLRTPDPSPLMQAMAVSKGSLNPAFNPDSGSYTLRLEHADTAVELTVSLVNADAGWYRLPDSIALPHNLTLSLGSPTADLTPDTATLRTVVVGVTGESKAYTLEVVRDPRPLNSDAFLAVLKPSAGTLSPAFHPDSLSYSVSLAHDVGELSLDLAAADTLATVQLFAASDTSAPLSELTLTEGSNGYLIRVVAEDGTRRSYLLDVVVQPRPLSTNDSLMSLTIDGQAFGPQTLPDTLRFPHETDSVTISGKTMDSLATLTLILGADTATDAALKVELTLSPDGLASHALHAIVVAENGDSSRNVVTLVRQARVPGSDAVLASLAPSTGTLSPAFHPDSLSYQMTFPYTSSTFGITAASRDPLAHLSLDGAKLGQDTPSAQKPLAVGGNTFVVEVRAEDSVTTRLYNIEVTRKENDDATLNRLFFFSDSIQDSISVSPSFKPGIGRYTVFMGSRTHARLFIQPNGGGLVKLNGIPKATVDVRLDSVLVGPNDFVIEVTAKDGVAKRTYNITVVREGNTNLPPPPIATHAGGATALAFSGRRLHLLYIGIGDALHSLSYSSGRWDSHGQVSQGVAGVTEMEWVELDAASGSDGTVYTAYLDQDNGRRPSVNVFRNGTWAFLGEPGVSTAYADAMNIRIAVSGSTPYLGFMRRVDGKATVLKWNGTLWEEVTGSNPPEGFSAMAVSGDTVYVAYDPLGSATSHVKMLVKGVWTDLGRSAQGYHGWGQLAYSDGVLYSNDNMGPATFYTYEEGWQELPHYGHSYKMNDMAAAKGRVYLAFGGSSEDVYFKSSTATASTPWVPLKTMSGWNYYTSVAAQGGSAAVATSDTDGNISVFAVWQAD